MFREPAPDLIIEPIDENGNVDEKNRIEVKDNPNLALRELLKFVRNCSGDARITFVHKDGTQATCMIKDGTFDW